MFKFKATLGVPSAAEKGVDMLFEALLSEQFSKRVGSDFSISFNESELKIEFCDVELTEKYAQKILGCGTVKKFYIENQTEPKNKPEKEIEAKVKVTENEQVTGLETEVETDSENKKEENKSDSEDDDANAETGVEETEPEAEPEVIPEVKAEEETEPEAEPEVILEVKAEEETEPEAEPEVIPEVKAEEETEPEAEPEVIPEAEVVEGLGLELEQEQEVAPEAKAEEKSPKVKSSEEFSKEYAEKLYEESENLEEFSGKLADYIQISDSRIRNAFEELIKAVAETQKMSWFCIENIIKRSSQNLYKRAEFNTNTKVLISKAVKERFNLTLLVFLKLIKELMKEISPEAEATSESEQEAEEISEEKTEKEPESELEVVPETKSEEEPEPELELKVVPEAKSEEDSEPEPEPEETTPEAKAERKPESESKQEETLDEYWSGIFKCMPKIISTDKYRIENVSKKEQQFLAINKSNPIAFRIKEVLEIMEDISLIADPNFITLSEKIFTKVPVIKVEKSMALYEKMRLLQWSKMLQKFVQRYYTKDPNFRVRIESFLTELREIIMTPEEIAKIK